MNDALTLREFDNGMFRVSVAVVDDKVWFPATECAKMLGYLEPEKAVRTHCLEEGVSKMDTPSAGGKQQKKYITESAVKPLASAIGI